MTALLGAPGAPVWVAFVLAGGLALALWIDRRWGEPPAGVHPVVWMGHYLRRAGRLATGRAPAVAFLLGAAAWTLGALAVGAMTWAVQAGALAALARLARAELLSGAGAFTGLVPVAQACTVAALLAAGLALVMKPLFAWRMLREEATAVETALQHSLGAGRERLSLLVSRDTAQLSEAEVRQSAIESLAENLSDSVVAPVFWFVVFGLPGAAVYRFANTADAMWGYRGQHWEWAGKWAARADDLLSWLPARLTAALLLLVARTRAAADPAPSWADVAREARKTPSPNSGWPMAAAALVLEVRLGKPGVYLLNPSDRDPWSGDMDRIQGHAAGVVRLAGWLACAALFALALLPTAA